MGWKGWMTAVAFALVAWPGCVGAQESAEDRIYGRVVTAAGDVFEGFIRWDRNEASWADLLNGDKEIPWRNIEDAERLGGRTARDRERSVEFLGVRISWDEDDDYPSEAQSGIRFGHVRTLTVLDDDAALLLLKNGEEVELSGGSTDIGTGVRAITVDDPQRGEVELRWRDLDVLELLPAPPGAVPSHARLYGTVLDRYGNEFTGYIAWDSDEMFDDEILDGEEDGHDREIPFRNIAAIERSGYSASRVTLTNGEEMLLRGSNDVDDDNRGIQVADPDLGQVLVEWEDFESLRLHPPAHADRYDRYDGGKRLYGTVLTDRGDEITGYIRWDNDEEYTWEILDGDAGDSQYDIELGEIERIERRSSRSSVVTLRDGRRFELEDSNDVDDGNKGIFVEIDDGSLVLVPWDEFREVAFAR
ncbi:MAG: hypothetical protein PVI57_22855 [Gemmatimonadota bacterium]|jgi:hypothetical protein